MVSRPPPRFVVSRHVANPARQRLWRLLPWLLALLATVLLIGLLSRQALPVVRDLGRQRALQSQINQLKQQVANLQRAAQVNEVATGSLRGTLAQREREISGLRADLGFYSQLVGGDTLQGLKVQQVRLQPIAGMRGWNLVLSLTRKARRGDETSGSATVSVEGLRANKVIQLDWSALGNAAQKQGMPFRFLYFQQLHGTIVLPADFRPTRLRVLIQPDGDTAITRSVAWNDALTGTLTSAQGDRDVQS